jgi:RHS repeat-associated protein
LTEHNSARLMSECDGRVPTRTFTVQYTYDAASNRVTLTDPENGTTHYSYDTLNRLTGLNDFQSHNFTFSYDALSRRTQLTRPNGINTNYAYDNESHLLSVLHQLGSSTLDGASYTYDSAGNRTVKTDQASNVTSSYGYDAIYQLTGVSQGSTTTESYTYDTVGNRLSSLGMSPYNYNSSNQLTSTPSATYTYDSNGSTKTKVDSSGTTTYNWDYQNQLSSIVLPASGGTVSFKYDPFGRRIQKSAPSGTVNYLYDGANAIEEVDSGGNVLARYTHEPRWDGPLSMLRGSVTSYYEQDGLNSVASLTNSSGALAQSYTYDSYGKITASTGTLTNPFQYTGREFDPETGIYYYRARYYDQSGGRFLSEDPKQFAGGTVDFYDYVGNNPVNMRDPEGQIPIWGWWCGPNWTGGAFAPYDPSKAGQYHKPWGDTDTACMHHDICYYECRRDHPCSKGDRAACMRKCDSILMSAAPHSIMGNTVSWWVWNGNKNPDMGDNAPNCPGCQSSSSPPPPPQKPCHGWGCVDNR